MYKLYSNIENSLLVVTLYSVRSRWLCATHLKPKKLFLTAGNLNHPSAWRVGVCVIGNIKCEANWSLITGLSATLFCRHFSLNTPSGDRLPEQEFVKACSTNLSQKYPISTMISSPAILYILYRPTWDILTVCS